VTTKTLSEIRKILMEEHADIRAQIEETRTATASSDTARQRSCLARLASTMQLHNAAEEAALKAILPSIDAWGPLRQKTMLDEHLAEHAELYATLVEASSTVESAGAIVKLLDKMLVHIAHEEKEFLGAELLTDEMLCDGFGG